MAHQAAHILLSSTVTAECMAVWELVPNIARTKVYLYIQLYIQGPGHSILLDIDSLHRCLDAADADEG